MIWDSFSEFAAMGGYAFYVWGALGVTFAAMAIEAAAVGQRFRAACTQVRLSAKRRKA
ncbi:MAG: heme exporter protein CcmD [Pseudomonadota bacterium]